MPFRGATATVLASGLIATSGQTEWAMGPEPARREPKVLCADRAASGSGSQASGRIGASRWSGSQRLTWYLP